MWKEDFQNNMKNLYRNFPETEINEQNKSTSLLLSRDKTRVYNNNVTRRRRERQQKKFQQIIFIIAEVEG